MTFTNTASLTYNQNVVQSNVVIGEVIPALTMTKSASEGAYYPDGRFRYTITMITVRRCHIPV